MIYGVWKLQSTPTAPVERAAPAEPTEPATVAEPAENSGLVIRNCYFDLHAHMRKARPPQNSIMHGSILHYFATLRVCFWCEDCILGKKLTDPEQFWKKVKAGGVSRLRSLTN